MSTGLLDGAVFSARYLNPDNAVTLLENARDANTDADILIDPEFYASLALGWENSQLGKLEKWDYLRTFKRRELARTGTVEELLKSVYKRFAFLPVTSHIAPNIYISNSFDSIEASIALGFIERTKECFGDGVRPVYATLAIDRKALLNTGDFLAFLNDLTATEVPPDGFYILVGGGSVTERSDVVHSEIMDAEVLGAWMMLNYALTENGFKVINGFTDILTPFLVAAGATGCSTGWWTNLRV